VGAASRRTQQLSRCGRLRSDPRRRGSAGRRWWIARYDGDSGATIWSTTITGGVAAGFGYDIIEHVAIDSNGDIFASGQVLSADVTNYTAGLAKFDGETGEFLWGADFGFVFARGCQHSTTTTALELDASDNAVVSMLFPDGSDERFRVDKVDGSNGDVLWSYVEPTTTHSRAVSMAVDSSGDVVAVGWLVTGSVGSYFSAVKIDGTDGTEIWKEEIIAGQDASAAVVTLDNDDNLLIGGTDKIGWYSFTVVKVSTVDGATIWKQTLPIGVAYLTSALAIKVDSLGRIFAGGTMYWGSNHGPGVLSLDPDDGEVLWQYQINGFDVETLTLLQGGGVAASGQIGGNGLLAVALSPAGALLWEAETPVAYDRYYALATAPDGDVVIGGQAWIPGSYLGMIVKVDGTDGHIVDCGNGQLEIGEGCDDGNVLGGDCCSAECIVEDNGSPCDDGIACTLVDECVFGGCYAAAGQDTCACGDGSTDFFSEVCDDGNHLDSDCCSADCQQVTSCSCGDGVLDSLEECDDGNESAGDCCDINCHFESDCSERFKCYKGQTQKDTAKFVAQSLTVADQFESGMLSATKPNRFCNPAAVGLGETVDDAAHLECYKIKDEADPAFSGVSIAIQNEFGAATLAVGKAAGLCLPTAVGAGTTDLDADRFKCYKAKGEALDETVVDVVDAFEGKLTIVGAPALVCAPAASSLASIEHAARIQVCYKIKDSKDYPQAKFVAQNVTTENSFGEEAVTAVKPALLCVPSRIP
jgi:cysteine-rich repeat protein